MPETPCSIAGCDRPKRARGMCKTHYSRWRIGSDLTKPVRQRYEPDAVCDTGGCEKPKRRNGLCAWHNVAAKKADPSTPRCVVDECTNPTRTRGMCETHYSRWRDENLTTETCAVEPCSLLSFSRRLCRGHYARFRKYDLSFDEFVLLIKQNSACVICGGEPTAKGLMVDHDHETRAVRGMLCTRCNTMLGHAKDDPDVLLAGAAYLLASKDVLRSVS